MFGVIFVAPRLALLPIGRPSAQRPANALAKTLFAALHVHAETSARPAAVLSRRFSSKTDERPNRQKARKSNRPQHLLHGIFPPLPREHLPCFHVKVNRHVPTILLLKLTLNGSD